MTIDFQSTYAEYEEACRATSKFLARERKKGILIRVLPAAFAVYVVAAFAFWLWGAGADSSVVIFHLFGPFILTGLLIPATIILGRLLTGQMPRFSKQAWTAIGMIVLIAAGVGAIIWLQSGGAGQPKPASWTLLMLLPHTTWIGLVIMLAILTARHSQNEIRDHWERHPTLTRRKTVEITADGVVIRTDVNEEHHHWEGFAGSAETKNLFVLMTSIRTAQYLPKRAFANEEEIKAMRALMEMIPQQKNRAFPLEPIAVPASCGSDHR